MTRAFLILADDILRERAIRWCRRLPLGTRVVFHEPKRTLDQNAKLWPMLTEVSRQVEWYGEHLSPDDWKDVFTASLRRARVVPGIDAGSFVVLGMRTSKMSKAEFSDLLEVIYAFGAQRGVTWSEPLPPELERHARAA